MGGLQLQHCLFHVGHHTHSGLKLNSDPHGVALSALGSHCLMHVGHHVPAQLIVNYTCHDWLASAIVDLHQICSRVANRAARMLQPVCNQMLLCAYAETVCSPAVLTSY